MKEEILYENIEMIFILFFYRNSTGMSRMVSLPITSHQPPDARQEELPKSKLALRPTRFQADCVLR